MDWLELKKLVSGIIEFSSAGFLAILKILYKGLMLSPSLDTNSRAISFFPTVKVDSFRLVTITSK
jgi:hypothetical protein